MSRNQIFPLARCPECGERLTGTEFETTREFRCDTKSGCGWTFDENVNNAQGQRRER